MGAISNIFTDNLTLLQVAAGTIARTPEVRLKSQVVMANSTFTGNITYTVLGITKNLSVTGTVQVPARLSAAPAGSPAVGRSRAGSIALWGPQTGRVPAARAGRRVKRVLKIVKQ